MPNLATAKRPLPPFAAHVWRLARFAICLGFTWAMCLQSSPALALPWSTSPDNPYHQRLVASPDGIGKVFMGREISQVMGYQGAFWLERPTRAWEEAPERILTALNLQPTDVIADVGAGTGYLSALLSPLVPQGQVLAVDVQPEMIDLLTERCAQEHLTNVQPILSSEQDLHLSPQSLDLAVFVDVYHELAYPREILQNLRMALKPSGRVALVEYRGENPLIPIKPHHKMTERQVKRELTAAGFQWQETIETLPQQHIVIFQKPA